MYIYYKLIVNVIVYKYYFLKNSDFLNDQLLELDSDQRISYCVQVFFLYFIFW